MSAWDEKAEEAAERDALEASPWAPAEATRFGGFVEGARWQREALLADDVIERAARRIYRRQVPAHLACVMTQWEEAHERQRDHFRSVARAALAAAIGEDDDE